MTGLICAFCGGHEQYNTGACTDAPCACYGNVVVLSGMSMA